MSQVRNRLRISQTTQQLEKLRNESDAWLDESHKPQYDSQLASLGGILKNMFSRLENALNSLSGQSSTRVVYSSCRDYERRILYIRRIWEYYREKFAQRQDKNLKEILEAADEITWSCYVEAFRTIGQNQGPVPLPYIDNEFSPFAYTRENLPEEIDPHQQKLARFPLGLQELVQKMPIPVIGLPPACIDAPWWLVYLAHETGHHIQQDLHSAQGLEKSFQHILQDAVRKAPYPGNDEDEERWARWGKEIFADVWSIYCAGSGAVSAMMEMLLGPEEEMLAHSRRSPYPSPALRLSIMGEISRRIYGKEHTGLGDFKPEQMLEGPVLKDRHDRDLRALASKDYLQLDKVLSAIIEDDLDGLGTFEDVLAWEREDFLPETGRVRDWAEYYLGETPDIIPKGDIRDTRLATSAAVLAWQRATSEKEEVEQDERLEIITKRIPTGLILSREEGTRAGGPTPEHDLESLGKALDNWFEESREEDLSHE